MNNRWFSPQRPGVSLIELIVGLVIMVILAATITPSIVRQLDRVKIKAAADELDAIADAITSFKEDVELTDEGDDDDDDDDDDDGDDGGSGSTTDPKYAATLTQLVNAITTSDRDICGDQYDSDDVSEWSGPYLNRVVPSSGLKISIGTVNDDLDFVNSGANDLIQVVVPGVMEEDAIELNERVDDDGSSSDGTVRWTTADDAGLVTVKYTIPAGDAC